MHSEIEMDRVNGNAKNEEEDRKWRRVSCYYLFASGGD
jgi:hypothetical protein